MNNDLISREALREAFHKRIYYFDKSSWDEANALIDNAETVEYTFEEAFQKTVCENRLYCPARPKGEWKETGYETGALGITYRQTQCSNCGWEQAMPMWLNYCPNCGADMKGGAE